MQKEKKVLVPIARRYYVDGLSQQEIAKEFGISRPTVSNILKKCRELGIVKIQIEDGYPYSTAVGDQLKKSFGLENAIIVPVDQDQNITKAVGTVAGEYATSLLNDDIKIGIAWGTSLYHMVQHLPALKIKNSTVVQLMGGFGAALPQYDGSELAREFSKKIDAHYYPLQCPVIVNNIVVKELLSKELGISETLEQTKNLDLAFVGISSNSPNQSAMVRAGFISEDEAKEIQAAGAVGHICGYSYDDEGKLLDISYNNRIIGIDFNDFLNIPIRVGVAYGIQKAEAIRCALKAKLITTLITNEATAKHILKLA